VFLCNPICCSVKAVNNVFTPNQYDYFQNIAFPIEASSIRCIFQDSRGLI